MIGRRRHLDPASGRVHAVELRRSEAALNIAILEESETGNFVEVWQGGFDDPRLATSVFRVMRAWPARWRVWSDMSRLLGAEFVLGLIKAEAASATDAMLAQAREDASRTNRRRARGAIRVELWLPKDASFITAVRSGRQFMCLQTHDDVQALRLWDWVRWQNASFYRWYEIAETHGQDVLRGRIVDWMLAAERRMIAAGLSPGGQRPLRYWKPTHRHRVTRLSDRCGEHGRDEPQDDPEDGGC